MDMPHQPAAASGQLRPDRVSIAYAAFFFRFRGGFVAAAVAMTVTSLYGLTHLEINDSLVELFKAENSDYHQLEQFFDEFGADDRDCIIVLRGDSLFSRQSIATLRRLVAEAESLDQVDSVLSVLDVRRPAPVLGRVPIPVIPRDDAEEAAFEQARQRLLRHPLVANRIVSADGRTMLVLVRLSDRAVSTRDARPVVEELRRVLQRSTAGTPLQASLTGVPEIRVEVYSCVQRDHIQFAVLGFLVAVTIATCLFQRPAAVLVCCLPPVLGAVWTLGFLGLVGEPLNTLNSILPTLVFVIGFADSVHLTVHVRHRRNRGLDSQEATAAALRELFRPCALTSFSTAVGFGSLMVAQINAVQRLGAACAAGAVLNFLAVVIVVPLLSSSRLGNYLAGGQTRGSLETRLYRLLDGYVGWITRRPRTVATAGIVFTLVLLVLAMRLEPENSIREGVPLGSSSYESLEHCEGAFGGAVSAYAVVQWPEHLDVDSGEVLSVLVKVHRILGDAPQMGSPFSILNVLATLPPGRGNLAGAVKYLDRVPPETLGRLVRRDLHKAAVDIQTPDRGARAMNPVYAAIEDEFRQLQHEHPGFHIELTGSTVVATRNVNQIIVDLCRSLALAALVIFGTIMIVFRSVRTGLISLLPNVIPLASVAAVLYFLGGALHVSAAIVFSISLGIAVDDTIHFISRFRLEWNLRQDPVTATRRSVAEVGSALVITTLTLLGGFGMGMFSDLPALRTFSFLSCVALTTALAADVTVLPALLTWYGKSKTSRYIARG